MKAFVIVPSVVIEPILSIDYSNEDLIFYPETNTLECVSELVRNRLFDELRRKNCYVTMSSNRYIIFKDKNLKCEVRVINEELCAQRFVIYDVCEVKELKVKEEK